jgi:Na+/H+ antiporter NhaC
MSMEKDILDNDKYLIPNWKSKFNVRKKAWLPIIVVFLLMIAFVVYKDKRNENKRKQNRGMTKGIVVGITQDAMNGGHLVEITYKIQVEGKEITRMQKFQCGSWATLPINITLDVVYEKGNPENCELLLSTSAYKTYDLRPPKEILYLIDVLEGSCGS